MKIKNFTGFLLEYEGGPPVKDPIKIGDRMIDDIEEEEEEEDKDKDIPILQDLGESIDTKLDPYNEENWIDPQYSYKNWKGTLEDFLRQLNNDFIDEVLETISKNDRKITKSLSKDIIIELKEMNFPQEEIKRIGDDIYELETLACDYEEDEDEGPDPDEAYDQWVDSNLD
jgi:hypothetical protein